MEQETGHLAELRFWLEQKYFCIEVQDVHLL